MSWIPLAVVLASAVVITAGCSKDSGDKQPVAERMGERMMEKALSQGGEKVKVELGDKRSIDLTGLPETLRYPGAEPIGHVAGAEPGTNSETFVLQTSDVMSDVIAFYKSALTDYQLTSHMESPQMVTMAYTTRDGKSQVGLVIGSRNQSGKTSMNVTVTSK
jgi:hypothetical protein